MRSRFTVSRRRSSWAFWWEKGTRLKIIPDTIEKPFYLCSVDDKTLAARGLEELFSSCAVVSVFGSGGK
jgi:hypothetical protein